MPLTLAEICLEACSQHVDGIVSLQGVPEDLCCLVFQRVLQLGKLNPKVLVMFQETDHELLQHQIDSLNLQELPVPAYSNRNRWLGDKPRLY
mmetsp:Transcript_31894/g.81660  ORF Transcript_31894/g.81660 Transcript_31894/m.81660 type:complete len:92 (-) Transcript_31894:1197-1472(-)|eukprot:jgi/Tetstr1/424911/TSEL_015405.t1